VDSTYWGLSEPDVVTAWVAFTSATEANGAMEYIPGSHKLDQIPHRDTFAKHNLLTRGQEVMVEVDHSRRRIITLRPGEMSLQHVRLVYGSPPNPSNDRHIGFAIRYIPTGVAQLAGKDSATLPRGEDRHHHLSPSPFHVRAATEP
jgi:ectoine hydroxylase-related dioxygenase (phytanoyl-CoA dioxygenase family)